MIRVFTKKALRFFNPANRLETVTTRAFDFAELPDWAAKDRMFDLAKKSGDLEVVTDIKVAAGSDAKNSKNSKNAKNSKNSKEDENPANNDSGENTDATPEE